jgi:hypothetical protein
MARINRGQRGGNIGLSALLNAFGQTQNTNFGNRDRMAKLYNDMIESSLQRRAIANQTHQINTQKELGYFQGGANMLNSFMTGPLSSSIIAAGAPDIGSPFAGVAAKQMLENSNALDVFRNTPVGNLPGMNLAMMHGFR